MNVWQNATGERGRDYRELFFDYDLMLIWLGDYGDAREHDYSDSKSSSYGNQVNSFAYKPKPGDRVIMRLAREIIGVGQIPESDEHQYTFNETFRCVYGWNCSHCRRVIWATKYDLGKLAKVYEHRRQQPQFNQVHEKRIVEMVRNIDSRHFRRRLKKLPTVDTSVYTDEELGVKLFSAGISNRNIGDILTALQQAERLVKWYESEGYEDRPTEHEIVSHMILPLFLGLGWSHQQIAVEWNRIDMAFFKSTPTMANNCVMILEAKGLGKPLGDVLEQPKSYVRKLGLKNVRYILTTDGINMFVYRKKGNEWAPNPVGYLSIQSLQKKYILPKGTGLVDALVRLQPSAI